MIELSPLSTMEGLRIGGGDISLGAPKRSEIKVIPMQQGNVIGFLGEPGMGKSVTTVKFARHYHDMGFRVFADFKLDFGQPYTFEELMTFPDKMMNCVIIMDEIKRIINRPNTLLFELLTRFMEMRRKLNINILWATQFDYGLPFELLLHTQFTVHPRNKFRFNPPYLSLVVFKLTQGMRTTMRQQVLKLGPRDFTGYDTSEVFDPYERFNLGAGKIRKIAKRQSDD